MIKMLSYRLIGLITMSTLYFIMPFCSSMIDTSPSSLTNITPSFTTLNNILMTGFSDQVETDSGVLEIASFDWGILDEDTIAPFIVCVNGGRPGVEQLLSKWSVRSSEPLWTRNKMTCFMTFSTENEMTQLLDSVPQITYLVPMSGLYQVEVGLIDLIATNGFSTDPVECQSGIRFLAPSHIGEDSITRSNLINKIKSDINSLSVFTSILKSKFYWLTTENLPSQERTRVGQIWLDAVKDVTSLQSTCDFSKVNIVMNGRTMILDNLCGISLKPDQLSKCILSLVAYLTTLPEASYIENVHQAQPDNIRAARIVQSGNSTSEGYPYWKVGLNGTGQLIQVFDTGIWEQNCYFKDTFNVLSPMATTFTECRNNAFVNMTLRKVVQIVSLATVGRIDNNGHGTHVAGTICGYNPGTTPGVNTFAGMSPAAKLSMFYSGVPYEDKYGNIMNCTYGQGARISSFSFGGVNNVNYGTWSLSMDQYLYSFDEVMHFNSASNDGKFGRATRSISNWGNAKNIVCVGSGDSFSGYTFVIANMSVVAPYSSIGPVPAGRLKPDIISPGHVLQSANTNTTCGVIDKSGTSMACPSAAGNAALVRQYYMEGYYPTGVKTPANAINNPSGALIKATLITSAKPMTAYYKDYNRNLLSLLPLPPPPNIWSGFGLIQLQRVLRLNNEPYPILYIKDRRPIAEGQVHTYKFSVPTVTKTMGPFEISIVWTDPPSNVASGGAVLNNLDITATRDSDLKNKIIYPNNNAGPDIVNNVEKIWINSPKLGEVITIRVTGTDVAATATQNYSMVAAGVYVPAAWYCQDPRSIRPNTLYTTSNCRIACQTFKRNPICCKADVGDQCTTADASDSYCTGLTKPSNC